MPDDPDRKMAEELSPVGRFIVQEILEKEGINKGELAKKLGVSRQSVYALIKGRRPLTELMAMRLSGAFGRTPQFWLDLKDDADMPRDLTAMQQRALLDLKKHGGHILVDYELHKACSAGLLIREQFDPLSVQPASYDIRIGKANVYNPGQECVELDEDNTSIIMKPGAVALVESLEVFDFPKLFLGRLGQTTTLTENCIVIAHGFRIDPGFRGSISTTLRNVGQADFLLEIGNIFISLEIELLTVEPMRGYEGNKLEQAGFSEKELESLDPGDKAVKEELQSLVDRLRDLIDRQD